MDGNWGKSNLYRDDIFSVTEKMSIIVACNQDLVPQYSAWVAPNPMKPEIKKAIPIVLKERDGKLHLPFAKGITNVFGGGIFNEHGCHAGASNVVQFKGTLRAEQEAVETTALGHLETSRTCIVAYPPGFGKTMLAISLLAKMHGRSKFASVIVVGQKVLQKQWEKTLASVLPAAKIHILQSKKPLPVAGADIVICSIQMLVRWPATMSANLLVADEIHRLTSAGQSIGLLKISPNYILGLSATPYRNDDLHCVLEWIFGANILTPPNVRQQTHFVYKIQTGLMYKIGLQPNGKLNFNDLLDQQARDAARTDYIVNVMLNEHFAHIQWLVIVRRNVHIDQFVGHCFAKGLSVSSLGANKNDYNPAAKVIVGTAQKIGTGFDEPTRTGLVIASDTLSYYTQLLGRIFRDPENPTIPIVLDVVDNVPICERHYRERAKIYSSHGGKITTC